MGETSQAPPPSRLDTWFTVERHKVEYAGVFGNKGIILPMFIKAQWFQDEGFLFPTLLEYQFFSFFFIQSKKENHYSEVLSGQLTTPTRTLFFLIVIIPHSSLVVK